MKLKGVSESKFRGVHSNHRGTGHGTGAGKSFYVTVKILFQVPNWKGFFFSFFVLFLMEKAAAKCSNDITNEGENYR